MDDQTPELDGTGELADELELGSIGTEDTDGGTGGDPLNDIIDEAARAEAKKDRAIARRLNKKPEAKPEVVAAKPASEFLTKADFQKANERKAIREVTADAEIKAVWSEVVPFYTPRRGRDTAEDIKEDIQDAITLYRARNPIVIKDDSADQLTTTPVVKTAGSVQVKATVKAVEPPNFKLPTQPTDWYPKK